MSASVRLAVRASVALSVDREQDLRQRHGDLMPDQVADLLVLSCLEEDLLVGAPVHHARYGLEV